jgi:cyclopropane-fatty-acyl-phospholipid synthase
MTESTFSTAKMRPANNPSAFEAAVIRIGKSMLPTRLSGRLDVTLPSGYRLKMAGSSSGPQAVLIINSWRVLARSVAAGSNGFAESYIRKEVDTPDLVALIRFFARNQQELIRSGGRFFRSRFVQRLRHVFRANSRTGSKRNISAHYDLSNKFFQLWLDDTMTYSSALFDGRDMKLCVAQRNKYDLVLNALNAGRRQSILEIGCGWGGFAAHLAGAADVRYTGITLSREQLELAQARPDVAAKDGFGFRYQDYRDADGVYDGIVSIEMIEAVGERNWPVYFSTLHDRLKPGGHAVVQSITMNHANFERYRRKADFIQTYIFPGGMLPSPELLFRNAEQAGLHAEEICVFPQDYAETLRLWRQRFEANWSSISSLGFDERFRRLWRFYLAYCEGAFAEGLIGVGIYRFTRPSN